MDSSQTMTVGGDSDAFKKFYQAWCPYLVRVARAQGLDRMDAEECAHDVLLRVWKKDLFQDLERPSWYLRQGVHWEINRRTQRRRSDLPLTEELAAVLPTGREGPEQTASRRELKKALITLIKGLPDRCGAVMRLVLEGSTQSEIAQQLNVGVGAVEKQVARGKQLLAEGVSSFQDGGGSGK